MDHQIDKNNNSTFNDHDWSLLLFALNVTRELGLDGTFADDLASRVEQMTGHRGEIGFIENFVVSNTPGVIDCYAEENVIKYSITLWVRTSETPTEKLLRQIDVATAECIPAGINLDLKFL